MAASTHVSWDELVTATVAATVAQMASGAPPLVTPTTMPKANFSSTLAPAAHVMSGQPPVSVVEQGQHVNIGGTTQGRGVTVEMLGRIVVIFRGHQYGYIRSEEGEDFFFGRAEYRPLMSVGDQVQFTYDPNRAFRGTCPMAVDIWHLPEGSVHSKGGKISGAQPAAMASTNSWNLPKRTYREVTNGGRVGSSVLNTTTKLGATTTVINGAAKSGVNNDVDVRLNTMQSVLENLVKDSTAVKQMLELMQRQRATLPS